MGYYQFFKPELSTSLQYRHHQVQASLHTVRYLTIFKVFYCVSKRSNLAMMVNRSSYDVKHICTQGFDLITTYPYEGNRAFMRERKA